MSDSSTGMMDNPPPAEFGQFKVSSLYTAELLFHVVTLLIMWPLYFSQFMSWRFTPKKKFNDTKLYLILIGLIGMIIQTIRTVDPSSAFKRLDLQTQNALYKQLGHFLMYAVILVVCATARTLCTQLSKTLPKWFVYSIYSMNITAHIATIPLGVCNAIYFPQVFHSLDAQHSIMKVFAGALIIWSIDSLVILGIYWVLYWNLRKKIAQFLVSLEKQEEAKRKSAEQMRTQLPASSPVLLNRGLSVKHEPDESGTPQPTGVSAVAAETQEHGGEAMVPPPSPSINPDAGTTAAVPSPKPSLALKVQTTTLSPVVSIRVVPSTSTVSSPTLTRAMTGTKGGAATPAPSQGDSRLKDLYSAIRKMNILTALLTILLVGTVLSQVGSMIALSKGEVMNEIVFAPYVVNNGAYRMSGAIQSFINQLGLAAILWYAWSSPKNWASAAVRIEKGTPFLFTLRFGVADQGNLTRLGGGTTVGREVTKTKGSGHGEHERGKSEVPHGVVTITPKNDRTAASSPTPRRPPLAVTEMNSPDPPPDSPAPTKAAW